MEAKLAAYRSKKRREAMVDAAKNTFHGALSWKDRPTPLLSYNTEDKDEVESIDSVESIDITPTDNTVIKQVTYLLYFLLWATLYVIAVQLEFGAIYFILSALFFIYKNTRSGPKKPGEISAYSVFNKNCQSIQGSINMEQLEREMGIATVSHVPG